MKTEFKYKALKGKGNVTTKDMAGELFPVVHKTVDGKVTLCQHNLHKEEKLVALRRNWVVVKAKVTCKACVSKTPIAKKAAAPRKPKVKAEAVPVPETETLQVA